MLVSVKVKKHFPYSTSEVSIETGEREMDLKLWWFALQKPVKEHDKRVWDSFDVIAKWLISTRATVTQLTLMAGMISGLLAYRDGFFDFLPWLAMTLGIYFAHSSENLVNDYIDYTRGIDEDNYYRGQYGIHPLVHKFWTKQDWARWFVTAGLIAVAPTSFRMSGTQRHWFGSHQSRPH